MARKSRGMDHIPFSVTLALGTLADSTVIVTNLLASLGEKFYFHSITALCGLRDAQAGEGPIDIGYAHGNLSTTEIKENLTVNLADPDDIIAREQSRRPVRKVGQFAVIGDSASLNDGQPLKRAIRFSVGSGHAIKLFAYNRSGAALTTGSSVVVDGTIHGRWM